MGFWKQRDGDQEPRGEGKPLKLTKKSSVFDFDKKVPFVKCLVYEE